MARTIISVLFLLALGSQVVTGSSYGHLSRKWPRDAYFTFDQARMCVSRPSDVRWVFENHLDQLNKCNLTGLKAERTPETQLFVGANNIKGEQAVDKAFADFCKPRSEGGFRGIKFKEEKAFIVGNVITVQWVADAPFLKKPYRGSDAYATCGLKMLTIVSYWNVNDIEFV